MKLRDKHARLHLAIDGHYWVEIFFLQSKAISSWPSFSPSQKLSMAYSYNPAMMGNMPFQGAPYDQTAAPPSRTLW